MSFDETSNKGEKSASQKLNVKRLARAITVRYIMLPLNLLLLCGCMFTVGPDYNPAAVDGIPDEWQQSVSIELTNGNAPMHAWWAELDDDTLVNLIQRAHQNNFSIDAAVARVAAARADLGIAAGERVPNLTGVGSAERGRGSDGVSAAPPPQTRTDTVRQLGIESGWELDLWGRVRRSVESAAATYDASVEDLRDVLVIIYADIGINYTQIRTLQQRLVYAQANVQLQRETLDLVAARYRAELAPELELRQAELNLAVTESNVPLIESAAAKAIHSLSVLVGEPPHQLAKELGVIAEIPDVPDAIVATLPANALRQRPDVRRAERELAAQTARIGIATAALYPNFFLAGDFGYATAAGGLLNNQFKTWGLSSFFSWNLFDGARTRNSIRIEEALTDESLADYRQTVLAALQDIEDSLVDFDKERARFLALDRSVTAAARADLLVRELYRQGLTDFQNVLDTQRSLFDQQDSLADSQGTVLINLISLYRAFGGGWATLGEPTLEENSR